jgi:hypothetical protein
VELVVFTLVAVALYLLADHLLRALETRLGRRLEHRSVVFFALLLAMALGSFAVIRGLGGS